MKSPARTLLECLAIGPEPVGHLRPRIVTDLHKAGLVAIALEPDSSGRRVPTVHITRAGLASLESRAA